eukprot:COSAG05_NODE_367_length_10739_cov_10.311842_4_plen_173_part_00
MGEVRQTPQDERSSSRGWWLEPPIEPATHSVRRLRRCVTRCPRRPANRNKELVHRRPTPLFPAPAFAIFSQHTPFPRRGPQLGAPADCLAPIGRLAPCGLVSSSLRRSARRKRWPQGHPPTISPAATDRLHAGYTPLTSLRRRALSTALDRSAAIGQRAITICAGWARGGPC